MSTITPTMPVVTRVPIAPSGVRRITVDEYDRIIRSGSLDDPDGVELIDGYLVDKMAKSAEHGYATKRLIKSLNRMLPDDWTWRSEQPVRMPDFDELEPDVAVVRGTDEDYAHQLPGPRDVGLLIEISLTTLNRDRNEKLPSYARATIPVYWIVNLAARQIEVYTDPSPGGYGSTEVFGVGRFVPVVIEGRQLGEIAVDDILPPLPATPVTHSNGS